MVKNLYSTYNKEQSITFTQLDILVAKILANLNYLPGLEKLAEFAGRNDKRNPNTQLLIKELGSLNEDQAVKLAISYWKQVLEDTPYSYSIDEFITLTSNISNEKVIDELKQLLIETNDGDYFRRVLIPFLENKGDEVINEWLEKIAGDDSQQYISTLARDELKKRSEENQDKGNKWATNLIFRIKNHIDKKEYDSAAEEFEQLISPAHWKHSPEGFINNTRQIAELCDSELLEKWFYRYADSILDFKNLIVLAKEPKVQGVKKYLFEKANDLKLDYKGRKGNLWLVLGELDNLDTAEAEDILVNILEKTRQLPYFIKTTKFYEFIELGSSRNYKRHEIIAYLLVGLEKTGSDEAIQRDMVKSFRTQNSLCSFYF